MRVKDEVLLTKSENEGSNGLTEPSASVDSDSEVPQGEHNNVLEPSTLPDEQIQNKQTGSPEHRIGLRSMVPGVEVLTPAWKLVTIISIICLMFVALPHGSTEAFLEAPCKHPGLSGYFPRCAREPGLPGVEKPAFTHNFVALARSESRLVDIMNDNINISMVAVDMGYSEIVLRDLIAVIRHSSISRKDILEHNIKLYVGEAEVTGANLTRFSSRVWGAVDRIVSLNQYAIIMLEETIFDKSSEAPSRSLGGAIISLISTQWGWVTGTHRTNIEDFWLQAINITESTLHELIHEAEANVGALHRLSATLNVIQDLVSDEKEAVSDAEQALKKERFNEFFGLNKDKWRELGASLELLKIIQDNRSRALKEVRVILSKLRKISSELEDLREGVATPLLVETPGSFRIPIKAHIKSMQSVTERLTNEQTRMRGIEDAYRREQFASRSM